MSELREQLDEWPVGSVSAIALDRDGELAVVGEPNELYALASVTKPLAAYAALLATEEGVVSLDDPVGPSGVTLRHLLAHASGLSPDDPDRSLARPQTRRIYSNAGFELMAAHVAERADYPFADYLADGVLAPLGMGATGLDGSAAHGAVGSAADIARFAAELLEPALLAPETVAAAIEPIFPELAGVVPGFGRFDPNPWGLGFEIRGTKHPHWTAPDGSARTFGHFGRTGTFLWVDPDAGRALVCLSDREFGDWALERWPALSAAALDL